MFCHAERPAFRLFLTEQFADFFENRNRAELCFYSFDNAADLVCGEVYADKPGKKQLAYISSVVEGVCARQEELEGYLSRYSIGWNVSRISRLARACMELAMYEALYVDDVPMNVAINEAVKLAQKYEEPETVAFVNGVLGSFSRDRRPEA